MDLKQPTDYRQYNEDKMNGRIDKDFWNSTQKNTKDEKEKNFQIDVGRTIDDECFTVGKK